MYFVKTTTIINMATRANVGYITKVNPDTPLELVKENGDILQLRVFSAPALIINMATGKLEQECEGLYGIQFFCHRKMVTFKEDNYGEGSK